MARTQQSRSSGGVLVGLLSGGVAAFAWGLLAESAVQHVVLLSGDFAIERGPRLSRSLVVAASSGGVGASIALGWLIVTRGRVRGETLAAVGACAGAAVCAWLGLGFLMAPPDADAIVLTSDPILQRATMFAVATAGVVVGCALFGWRVRGRAAAARSSGWGRVALLCAAGISTVLVLLPAPSPGGKAGATSLPDIFFFSVDTLRADHLGCYGYPAPTSPAIDRLCEESIVFERAIAPVPTTIPSYTSMMTGLLPDRHKVYTNFQRVDPGFELVPEQLHEAGYLTALILDGGFPGTVGQLARGLDFVVQRGVTARSPYYTLVDAVYSLRDAAFSLLAERARLSWSATTRASLQWLDELPEGRPVFAHFYWNFPHSPYQAPAAFLEAMPRPTGLPASLDAEGVDKIHGYDAEIAYTDAQIDRVLSKLRERGRDRDAWIVFVSDHGEELGRMVEDGEGGERLFFGHSTYLYEPSVRVPLLVRPPVGSGLRPRREPGPVTTASLASSLLGMARLEAGDERVASLPLRPGDSRGRAVLSVARTADFDRVSIRTSDWLLVETRSPRVAVELFAAGDTRSEHDVASAHPDVARDLLAQIHAWDPADPDAVTTEPADLSEQERELLRELGYIE